MNPPPLVTVVIPAYNSAAFVAEAIESVLSQTYRSLEVMVIDDGSTDNSAAIVGEFPEPVRCYRQDRNRGLPAAKNQGIRLARGEFIAFLDADDLYTPDKIMLQIERLQSHPEVDVVIGSLQYQRLVSEPGESPRFTPMQDDHLFLQNGCGLFRRTVFEKVGLFDETIRYCDDWDWFMRARELGIGLLLHRHLVVKQRIHGSNMTRAREEASKAHLLMLKRSLDRRRAQEQGDRVLPPLSSFMENGEL